MGIAKTRLDLHRVTQVAFGNAGDTRRDRGREKHRLARDRCGLEDLLDVFGEPHVEHLVGLIEYDHLHPIERQRVARDVVERTPGGGDDDVDAFRQRLELPKNRLATVDRQDLDAQILTVLIDRLGDLHRELAGGNQYEGDREDLGASRGQHLQDRQGESRRLAGTRRGLTDQVVAVEQDGDRFTLDGCGLFVSEGD